jgi:hypothetical protein
MESKDFPFNIMDVASLLGLRVRRRQAGSVYTDCPFCGDNRGKMNINYAKNVFRCNYCDEHGGMLALYARVHGIGGSDAYRAICEALRVGEDFTEYKARAAAETPPPVPNATLAGADEIHQTLSALLEMLSLSEPHRKKLYERGLDDEQIGRLGCKSTPPPNLCLSLTERLMKQGCTVQGVPGFYVDDGGKWTVKFHKRTAGLLIPVKGIDGLIRGAQIRLDAPIKNEGDGDKEGTKYLWLSSSNKRMGVSSGSPVHFVGDPNAKTVYVTEGILKAGVAHCLMNRSFAAVAGANNTAALGPLFSLLAKNGIRLIVEAQDMDKYRNEQVDKGASKVYALTHEHGMDAQRLTWNPNYKGIDDWQLAVKKKKESERTVCMLNFKERFIMGLCGFNAIDDCVEAWHSAPENGVGLTEYLGLTQQEMADYLRSGEGLEEQLLAQRKTRGFRIYQLELTPGTTKPWAFLGIDALRKADHEQPPAADYRLIHDAELLCHRDLSEDAVLERIFMRFNDSLPDDYCGRSVSPSDVIELYNDEGRRYYYRDDKTGFVPVRFSPALALPLKARR